VSHEKRQCCATYGGEKETLEEKQGKQIAKYKSPQQNMIVDFCECKRSAEFESALACAHAQINKRRMIAFKKGKVDGLLTGAEVRK